MQWIHLYLSLHKLPFLTLTLFLLSLYLPHLHHPQAHNQPTTPRQTLNELHTPYQNLRILQWNAGGLSPSCHAELIAFLSNNEYDLILLQETHLSATKKFQIPGYFTLRTDRTFGRQGPVSSGGQNTGGGVLTLIHSDLAFSPVSVSSLSSQDTYSDYICVKILFSNHSPLQFLNLYSLPSEALLLILAPGPSLLTSFQTPVTLLSLETSMLITQPGIVSSPLTCPEMTCFAGSLPPVWKSWTTPPLPRSAIIPLGAIHPPIFR